MNTTKKYKKSVSYTAQHIRTQRITYHGIGCSSPPPFYMFRMWRNMRFL